MGDADLPDMPGFQGVGSVDGKVLRCDVYAQLRMMSLLMESNRNAPRPLELACPSRRSP